MAPLFTDDDLFDELVSFARAAAKRRGLAILDRLSFELGVVYALVCGKVKTNFTDLQLPDEAVLFAYAQRSGCDLTGLAPVIEPMLLEVGFRTDFLTKHLNEKSTLHGLLKDVVNELVSTLESQPYGASGRVVSEAELQPVYFSIVVAANREDFGIILPIPSAINVERGFIERPALNREKEYKVESQSVRLKGLVAAPGKANSIAVESKKKRVSEIDFGNPLGIPFVPDGLHLTPLPNAIALDRGELRLYVVSSQEDKAIGINRLPQNPDVWQLTLPPGATLKNSAPIVRAAAARLFLLATVGRKKIEISNLLQVKHRREEPVEGSGSVTLPFPFDKPDNVLGAYFAFCMLTLVSCLLIHPAIAFLSFTVLALAVSKDIFNARTQLLHLASRLGIFWGPQLALTIIGLALGIWPLTADWLHVDFLSATLYGSIPLIFSFTLVALDFQPQKEREAVKKHEEIHHALATHMHEITQTTLSVALGNLVRSSKPHTYTYFPEVLIRQMDKEIGTVEAVDGFRRLIQDRIKTTEATVKKTHEGQQHARRTVMAAGGAIFTGYFTFEAGEKVIEYQHLQSKCDQISFFHWQAKQMQNGSGAPQKESEAMTSSTMEVNPKHHYCSSYEEFNHHETHSMGMLLLATLAISLLTAIVAIRKPSDEHGGGGHH
jgi:hypothetical protein